MFMALKKQGRATPNLKSQVPRPSPVPRHPPKVPIPHWEALNPRCSCYTSGMTMELATSTPADRLLRAIELRIEGKSFTDIATTLGYPSAKTLARTVSLAITRVSIESPESIRALELLRLDQMLDKLWPWAMGLYKKPLFEDDVFTGSYEEFEGPPDYKAIDRILALMKRRADLAGLDAPKQTERTVKLETPRQKKPQEAPVEQMSDILQVLLNSGAIDLTPADDESETPEDDPAIIEGESRPTPGPRLLDFTEHP